MCGLGMRGFTAQAPVLGSGLTVLTQCLLPPASWVPGPLPSVSPWVSRELHPNWVGLAQPQTVAFIL